jgi:hypothetical protein
MIYMCRGSICVETFDAAEPSRLIPSLKKPSMSAGVDKCLAENFLSTYA